MGNNKTIRQLCVEYGCDKTPEIGHNYTPKYDKLFNGLKNIEKILEIGVGFPEEMEKFVNLKEQYYKYITGASLYVWRDYFVNANVYGIDKDNRGQVFGEDRIETFICDSTTKNQVKKTLKDIAPFDVIIDDGSHRTKDQLQTAINILPYLKKNGLYFIEDVSSPNWLKHKLSKWNVKILDETKRESLLLITNI